MDLLWVSYSPDYFFLSYEPALTSTTSPLELLSSFILQLPPFFFSPGQQKPNHANSIKLYKIHSSSLAIIITFIIVIEYHH